MSELLLSLAAQVVSAHVANNKVAAEELPKLINDVHHALANAARSNAAKGRTRRASKEIGPSGSPRLSRVRQALLYAKAPPRH